MAGKNGYKAPKGRRAVVVGGVRTPFCKAFTELTELDTIALGVGGGRGAARAHRVAAQRDRRASSGAA